MISKLFSFILVACLFSFVNNFHCMGGIGMAPVYRVSASEAKAAEAKAAKAKAAKAKAVAAAKAASDKAAKAKAAKVKAAAKAKAKKSVVYEDDLLTINGESVLYEGGSFGRNKQECINKGGTCEDVGCNYCFVVWNEEEAKAKASSEADIMYAGGSFGKAESDCRKKGGEYLGEHACSLDKTNFIKR